MAVHLAVAGDVFDGVLFCAVLFSHEMSWMRSGIELSQFLRNFSYLLVYINTWIPLCTQIPLQHSPVKIPLSFHKKPKEAYYMLFSFFPFKA